MILASRKITIEEALTTDEFEHFDDAFLPSIKKRYGDYLKARLHVDLYETRLEDMDNEGIDVQVLSLTSPGIQSIADPKAAVKSAKKVNDQMAEVVAKHPTRFKAMAALPWISPTEGAKELERAVTELGAVGVMLNGHTKGAYMDDERYRPVWERAEALDVPVYLHPIQSVEMWKNCEGYPELMQAAWGWAFETGTHFWRLVLSGLFDAHPNLTVILGHMGEGVPFGLWRFDDRCEWIAESRNLLHEPSYYAKHNMMVTTSGVCSNEALVCTQIALGSDRIMFAVDYPYQFQQQAVDWIDSVPISDAEREMICHTNAERIFKIE
jgi:2,3-dihydroxybenzoate decarboxylase